MYKRLNNDLLGSYRYIKPIMAIPLNLPGYEHYAISYFDGVIINHKTGNIVKGWLTKEGYRRCILSSDGIKSQQYIHRLVALSWIRNDEPYNKDEVNHINWIRHDCSRPNLHWCTKKFNLEYRYNFYMKQYQERKIPSYKQEPVPELSKDSDLPF